MEGVNVKSFEPSFGDMVGLEYSRDEMEGSLRGVVYSKSIKPARWYNEVGAVFNQTPKDVAL